MKTYLRTLVSACFSLLCCGDAFARSEKTVLCITNTTTERKLLLVEGINNYHWDGMSRPDHNWNSTYIEPGERRCEREEVSATLIYTTVYAYAKFNLIISGSSQKNVEMQYSNMRDVGGEPRIWQVNTNGVPEASPLRAYYPVSNDNWEGSHPCGNWDDYDYCMAYNTRYDFKIIDLP